MADAEIEQVLREQFLDLMEKTMALRMRPGPADDAYWAMRAWLKAAGWEYYLHCGWDRFYRLANDACGSGRAELGTADGHAELGARWDRALRMLKGPARLVVGPSGPKWDKCEPICPASAWTRAHRDRPSAIIHAAQRAQWAERAQFRDRPGPAQRAHPCGPACPMGPSRLNTRLRRARSFRPPGPKRSIAGPSAPSRINLRPA